MPELPEVETIRRALAAHVAGDTVTAVHGDDVQMRRPLQPQRIGEALTGRRLTVPRRRGKLLLVDAAGGGSLLIHLGMSGRLLLVTEPCTAAPPHTHLTVDLASGRQLRLVDPRRFGFAVWLPDRAAERRDPSLVDLGIEPLGPELERRLPGLVGQRRAAIKALILDQRLLAGVGNIYATEALWRARVRPTRSGRSIARARLAGLARCLREVLTEAVEAGGTTLRDYAAPSGNPGLFSLQLAVYGRHGLPCPACGASLRRSIVAGRTTTWCGRCQR